MIKPDMHQTIETYLADCPLSVRTIETYRVYLTYFSGYLDRKGIDPAAITSIQIKQWYEDNGWSDNTRRIAHCAIRSLLRHTYGPDHPALKMHVKPVDPGPQRTLTAEQVKRLIASLDTAKTTGIRNIAMILLMLDTGLRAAEVCRLRLADLNLEEKALKVRIKGGSWGSGTFSDKTAEWLQEWLRQRKKIAKPTAGTVFVSIGGLNPGSPISRDGLRVMFRRMGEKAGLGLISPHDLRRTFATLAIRNGAPTRLVQIAGRWKNIREVERYSRALTAADFAPYSPAARIMTPPIPTEDEPG